MTETPDMIHGRLLESVHICGYTWERACSELEWLLEENRWKQVGGGTDDINAFLATLDFSEFRIGIEKRKNLARRLQELQASQRATARMLGVGETTVRRDLDPALHGAPAPEEPSVDAIIEPETAPHGAAAPWFETADPARLAQRDTRRQERRTRAVEFQVPALPVGLFDVIYADPPWRYDFSPTDSREIENQYPTQSLEEIQSLAVPAADNAVLYLWATAPKLLEALAVIEAWGFTYRTDAIWDKEKIGMGYWFRGQHELLLVATKGDFSPPAEENRFSSVIRAARTEHSRKPTAVYDMLERMFPSGRFLELYARTRYSDRWTVWGNEAP